MLTTEEKNIISLIATDLETGRHLIRQKSEWKKVLKSCGNNLKQEDYGKLVEELDKAIEHFSWYSDKDESTPREKAILVQFKSCQDHDFYRIIDKKVEIA